MMPSRFTTSQVPGMRKSRFDGKPSYLPKPRNGGSIDRLSVEARSNARSSGVESRGTGVRLSRDSATKIPVNRRSRSQQEGSSRYGQAPITPLRASHLRPTVTPQRTPSADRSARSWQTSLDRALAFVTMKDQRPVSNAVWQRSEIHRVQELLAAQGGGDGGGGMALMRPLTITRFVDITGALLNAIIRDNKLNNDNYVTKIPHIAKLLLYPGVVSKSWLKTVNTLHAFPHALALISYLLDLLNRIESPVLDEWLYLEKDELAVLRRDFLCKCWLRFQEPDHKFDDLDQEYLANLKSVLGNDEEKIEELKRVIEKYSACLEDEVEAAARAHEARRAERHAALLAALRGARAARVANRAAQAAAQADADQLRRELADVDADIEKASAENHQLRKEVESQPMTVAERSKLLDEVDYANRVIDSKRALAEHVHKMLQTKESELALWQKKTLDSCLEYKQGLIHLTAHCPELGKLVVDENELMLSRCAETVEACVGALRAHVAALHARLHHLARGQSQARRACHDRLSEARATIAELKSLTQREQEALAAEQAREANDATACSEEDREFAQRIEALKGKQEEYEKIDSELKFWEDQEHRWRTKLSELQQYVEEKQKEAAAILAEEKKKRFDHAAAAVKHVASFVDNIRTKHITKIES